MSCGKENNSSLLIWRNKKFLFSKVGVKKFFVFKMGVKTRVW